MTDKTLEALDFVLPIPCDSGSANESRKPVLQSLRDSLPALIADAESYRKMMAAGPVAWMDDFGNAFPLAANKGAGSWRDADKRNWKPLYALDTTKESET